MAVQTEYGAGQFGWANFAKAMGELPFSVTLRARQHRNLEVLCRANVLAIDGTQALVNRQFEIARAAMSEFAKMAQSLMSPTSSPNDRLAQQAQHSRQVIETGFASVRELGEIVSNVQTETLGVINRHVISGLDEMHDYWRGTAPRAAAE